MIDRGRARAPVPHPREPSLPDDREGRRAAVVRFALGIEGDADGAVYAGDPERAVPLYGTAIEALLDEEAYEEATRIARKMLRVAPQTVRVRFTLAFLLVGAGKFREARQVISEYVARVRAAGTEEFAIPRLILLAHASDDPAFREFVVDALASLGASEGGILAARTVSPRPADAGAAGREPRARWHRLLQIAVRDL